MQDLLPKDTIQNFFPTTVEILSECQTILLFVEYKSEEDKEELIKAHKEGGEATLFFLKKPGRHAIFEPVEEHIQIAGPTIEVEMRWTHPALQFGLSQEIFPYSEGVFLCQIHLEMFLNKVLIIKKLGNTEIGIKI